MTRSIILFMLFIAASVAAAVAATPDTRLSDAGEDRFIAGERVVSDRPVEGDLIAAGGEVRMSAPVKGDVVVAGGDVRLSSPAGQDLYAAGGRVELEGEVARNARVAGGEIRVAPTARIMGNASVAGGSIEIRGTVDGYLQAAGGRILLDGPVQGDVNVTAGAVTLGPAARIAGRLSYASRDALERDPAAQVAGGIEERSRMEHAHERRGFPAGYAVMTAGFMVLAAVLVALFPGTTSRIAAQARRRFGWALLLGLLALVVMPAAVVLLAVTIVGLPLALILLLAYLAFVMTAAVLSCIAAGDEALARWQPARARATGWRAAGAALAVLVLALVAALPWVGALVAIAAVLCGMGALLMQLRAERVHA